MDEHSEDPRVTRSRALIVEAARECFIERGYDGTSVDDVAARAEIAKRTIYNIYGDKETLFRETVGASIRIAERFNGDLLDTARTLGSAADDIPELALRLARDVLLGRVVPVRLLVVREAARFPDLAAEYHAKAPAAVMGALAQGLAALDERGELELDDPQLAAEHFAFLVLGAELDRRMFGDGGSTADAVAERALAGARAFLRAYAAPRTARA